MSILSFVSKGRSIPGKKVNKDVDLAPVVVEKNEDEKEVNKDVNLVPVVVKKEESEKREVKEDIDFVPVEIKEKEDQVRRGRRFSVRKLLESNEAGPALPLPRDKCKVDQEEEEVTGLLEVVWAKYSGYPPWPAIVW